MNGSVNDLEDAACVESAKLEAEARNQQPSSATNATAAVADTAASLDPQNDAEWEEFRAEAHRVLDDTLQQLRALPAQAAWQPMPSAIAQALRDAPAPLDERSLSAVYAEVASRILPYTTANRHPRAWGWVRGQGTPVAMLADMIASAANAHVGGGATAPVLAEETVLRWLAEALEMRLPGATEGPSGILTSGATMANVLALAVARTAKAGFDTREHGLAGQPRLLVYASTETHVWLQKAVELLGLGRQSLRLIAAASDGSLPIAALRHQIELDRANGFVPIAVVANAGTVNTGAFDDLEAVRALCSAEDLWMHVDGAFGGLLKLSAKHRLLVAGLEQADSVAFDLHKWMYMPFETGCLLVRNRAAHHAAFATDAAYMERGARGMLAGELSFSDRGIESSRGFKALRVWMQLSVHGLKKHAALIDQNMEQAEWLASRIEQHPLLEMLAPRAANLVCFRYCGSAPSATVHELNTLNREVLLRLQESGRFVVSGTTLAGGAFALRVAITNHRSRQSDFAELVQAVVVAGQQMASQGHRA